MAEDFGKKLKAEIEEVGFDEILQQLRQREATSSEFFGLAPLDRLLKVIPQPASTRTPPPQPILELTSLAPGGGKTHLLYHLTALAVLPRLNGWNKHGCVVIIDTDGTFSVPRLVQHILLIIQRNKLPTTSDEEDHTDDTLAQVLKHVHIFRPQSLAATTATLHAIPDYLFDGTRHHSFDRPLAFIALDSASAFYWQDKAETEDAALLSGTLNPGTTKQASVSSSPSKGYTSLSTALRSTCTTFSCPAIFTSWHLGAAPTPQHAHHQQHEVQNLRPTLPMPFSQLPTLRLIVQRVPVKKFPPGISVEEALREAENRQTAFEEGRFDCVVNEWGMDERTLQRVQRAGGGFGFRISGEGVRLEEEEAG